MSIAEWFEWLVARIPGADEALKSLSMSDSTLTSLKIVAGMACGTIIAFITSSETIKLIWKTAFRSKARMAAQLEQSEKRNTTRHARIRCCASPGARVRMTPKRGSFISNSPLSKRSCGNGSCGPARA